MVTWKSSHSSKPTSKEGERDWKSDLDTTLQHDYEAGVEVKSLLSEVMEEVDGRLAVTDVDSSGQRYVKFWIDDFPTSLVEEQAAHHAAEEYAAEGEAQQLPASIPAFSESVMP